MKYKILFKRTDRHPHAKVIEKVTALMDIASGQYIRMIEATEPHETFIMFTKENNLTSIFKAKYDILFVVDTREKTVKPMFRGEYINRYHTGSTTQPDDRQKDDYEMIQVSDMFHVCIFDPIKIKWRTITTLDNREEAEDLVMELRAQSAERNEEARYFDTREEAEGYLQMIIEGG